MNIITSYFVVRKLPGTIALGGDVRQHQHARQAEYLECLQRNRQHPGVAAILLLVEGREAFKHLIQHVLARDGDQPATLSTAALPTQRRAPLAPVVPVVRLTPGLPTYADFFALANQLTAQRLTMVCNADVYLSPDHFHVSDVEGLFNAAMVSSPPPSQQQLQPSESVSLRGSYGQQPRLAVALTRYESDSILDAPFLYDYRGSHDAFIFVPPVPPSFLAGVQHAQNGYKAENVVLYELQQHGYLTLNPAFDVRLVHRHAADVRQWFPPVDETRYARAAPCRLREAHQQIDAAIHTS